MNDEHLLQLLNEHPGQYISGEEISRRMSVSRTAIWKGINRLKEKGYEFESTSRKGYRIIRRPDRFDQTALQLALSQKGLWGQPLHLFESVASTQDEARNLAEQQTAEGTLVIAEEQTAGRGRQGRPFYSPSGRGIWMSLVIRPTQPLQYMSQLTLVAAVAVCRALRNTTQLDIGIKWPNDLLIGGRKVCGILIESAAEDGRVRYAIAGIGIDANLTAEDLPEHLQSIATSLRIESGQVIDRTAVVAEVISELETLYQLYADEGFTPIAALWESMAISIGKSIQVHNAQGSVQGVAQGLGMNGELLLRLADDQVVPIYSGEIEF